jgi:putative beta-lysine N-acetyltransferase
MNALELRSGDGYYTIINGVRIFVDYTNKRLKILDYKCITDEIIMDIVNLAVNERLGKVISNCPTKLLKPFKKCGFTVEGVINGFFNGENAYCISLFIDRNREISVNKDEEDTIIHQCVIENKIFLKPINQKYLIRNAELNDIPQMINLFSNVFKTYPTPVFRGDYLQGVINKQIIFKVAVDGGKIISIASADMDKNNLNAEITDCATYSEYRGKGLIPKLIQHLEHDLQKRGFLTLYSLSRAINPGINKAFSKLEYRYCGRLVNNCHICGTFEDMNIWVKKLKYKV